ncbi:hypothetical protein COCOBI_03-6880 [Coccomyxa sp. Obi]|nr:hypothetical protein COCOBI_03-6880 [Coccomyxa sp. Obi]
MAVTGLFVVSAVLISHYFESAEGVTSGIQYNLPACFQTFEPYEQCGTAVPVPGSCCPIGFSCLPQPELGILKCTESANATFNFAPSSCVLKLPGGQQCAGNQANCLGVNCLVETYDYACCADGFACLSGMPSPTCQPSPYPVVPPYLQQPKLLLSESDAAISSAKAKAIATVFPSRDPKGGLAVADAAAALFPFISQQVGSGSVSSALMNSELADITGSINLPELLLGFNASAIVPARAPSPAVSVDISIMTSPAPAPGMAPVATPTAAPIVAPELISTPVPTAGPAAGPAPIGAQPPRRVGPGAALPPLPSLPTIIPSLPGVPEITPTPVPEVVTPTAGKLLPPLQTNLTLPDPTISCCGTKGSVIRTLACM